MIDAPTRSPNVSENRFAFGKNWLNFLEVVSEARIAAAIASLKEALDVTTLRGKRFLDVGCGSGLFSLAASRLGATVHSLDFDPQAVACTREMQKRYAPSDGVWTIEQASALDRAHLEALGLFDVVYSWGVLHHTGAMWQALENAALPVAENGSLWIAIYNDQGSTSRRWTSVKRRYNGAGPMGRFFLVLGFGFYFESRAALRRLLSLQNPLPFKEWRSKKETRGMSVWHDLVDWVGGYPFEVAKPEEIFAFYQKRGFTLTFLKTCGGGLGCNEFVFRKSSS